MYVMFTEKNMTFDNAQLWRVDVAEGSSFIPLDQEGKYVGNTATNPD